MPDDRFIDFAHIATAGLNSASEFTNVQATVNEHEHSFNAMLAIMGINADSDNAVSAWLHSAPVTAFAPDVDSISPAGEKLSEMIASVVSRAEKEGLRLPVNTYATAIWGKPQSIVFADSTMFIALNHYLGSGHPAYNGLPEYRRAVKDPDMLPYDIAEALVATAYPYTHSDSLSVINRLVYEGVIAMTKLALVKDAALSKTLGYTDDQLRWLDENESDLWRKLVGSKMIFDKSETVAERLVMPSPATTLLSPECPGRAGRYIGYKIVESYIKTHDDTSLPRLLDPAFYGRNNPLIDSGYNPR